MDSARLLLASRSPRRRQLLESLGWEFLAASADGDGPIRAADPAGRVLGHARHKAESLLDGEHWVLAADTLVFGGEQPFPKPRDRDDARRMLHALIGLGRHQVWTGAVLAAPDGRIWERADRAEVGFRPIPEEALEAYLRGTEWGDKAGAYAIQGWAGAYTELLDGDFGTVVGLSEAAVRGLLVQAGLPPQAFCG